MAGLYGRYKLSLDPKGRLAIPAKIRNSFPEGQQEKIFLTKGTEECITGYYLDEWKNFEDWVENSKFDDAEKRRLRRRHFSAVVDPAFDKQGRVTLSSELKQFAHLESSPEVLVVGCNKYIEIWNPEKYEEQDTDEDLPQRKES
jgi:MraZ protein